MEEAPDFLCPIPFSLIFPKLLDFVLKCRPYIWLAAIGTRFYFSNPAERKPAILAVIDFHCPFPPDRRLLYHNTAEKSIRSLSHQLRLFLVKHLQRGGGIHQPGAHLSVGE